MTREPSFWHPLPKPYITAIGEVIVNWAYFEAEFNDWMTYFLFHDPEAAKLGTLVNGKRVLPHPFAKRHKLFKDAALVCFGTTPTLVKKLHTIADQANRLHDLRDRLAHGQWAVGRHKGQEMIGSELITRGQLQAIRHVPLERLKKAAHDIGVLNAKLRKLRDFGGLRFPGWFELTSLEKRALQDFRMNNLPKLPKPQLPPLRPRSSRA